MLRANALGFCLLVMATACATGDDAFAEPPEGVAAFVGSYRGTLQLPTQSVPMALDIEPFHGDLGPLELLHFGEARYSFRLQYGNQAVRDYVLIVDDEAAGRCRLDEQNGIVLPTKFRKGELISVFTVSGSTLVIRYRLVPGGLRFALESFDPNGGEQTGNGVRGFAEVASQRALLRRV